MRLTPKAEKVLQFLRTGAKDAFQIAKECFPESEASMTRYSSNGGPPFGINNYMARLEKQKWVYKNLTEKHPDYMKYVLTATGRAALKTT